MELEDLKKAWLEQPDAPRERLDLGTFKSAFSPKTAGLQRVLLFEFGAVVLLLGGLVWLWFFGSIYRGLTVRVLIFGAVGAAGLNFWRLFRAFRGLGEVDFSKNVIASLAELIEKAEREVRIYRRSAWAFFVLMAVVLCFDDWFLGMNWRVKSLVLGLLAFSFWTTRPYLNWIYGRKLAAMRRQLESFSGSNLGSEQ